MNDSLQPGAVIFDMDGVLMDSEPLHFASFRRFLDQFNVDYTEAQHGGFVGQTSRQIFGHLKRENPQLQGSLDALIAGRQEHFARLIDRPLEPMPGVVACISTLDEHGIPLAVASSSNRMQVETILENLGIRSRFSVVIPGDEVERSKPAPDIYLRTCEDLACAPSRCLVFEDSAPGVQAASAAGAFVIAVPCSSTLHHDLSPAMMHLSSLAHFDYRVSVDEYNRWTRIDAPGSQ